ncbi:Acyl transferase/acyl hydrolase/lysophospholipase, partial [Penicillium rubens]|uniref:Acyl transferase/acyl hydrolase/lysophospholipase n=1 Tax=Penicillium rubens TaxID=1108849 RepID=UPI002A59E055
WPTFNLFNSCERMLWVRGDDRSDPNAALITGLIRTVRWEQDFRQQNLVTLEIGHRHNAQETITRISRIYRYEFATRIKSSAKTNSGSAEYRASVIRPLQTNRLVLHKPWTVSWPTAFPLSLPKAQVPGLLDRLHFKDCFVYPIPLKDDEVEYRVHATGLNFFDAMPAMGEVPIAKFGGEASGVVTQAGPNVKRGAMELWQLGVFRPTSPFTTFRYSQLKMAFRQLQSGRHSGKLVFTIDGDDLVETLPWTLPPCQFQEDAIYLLSGGLGRLGRSAARSGGCNADAQLLLNELSETGCDAQVLRVDVGDSVALDQAIRPYVGRMPPIRGCIQGAMTLLDSDFEPMTSTAFEVSVRAKTRRSWNLHEVLPTDLDFFNLLASTRGIIGKPGQGNYNIGNTFQDALAYSRSRGLGGTSFDLGHTLDVGVIAERTDNLFAGSLRAAFENQAVSQDEFHALPDHFNTQTSSVCPQTVMGLGTCEQFLVDNLPEPAFLSYPQFTHLWRLVVDQKGPDEASENRLQIVIEGAIEKLSSLLSISASEVDSKMAASDYGMDSLVDIEVRNWLSKEVDVEVGVLDIVDGQSIVDLGERVLKFRG